MNRMLTVAEIEDSITMLPAFPGIVLDLLATTGDEAAGRRTLAAFYRRDPISADRVRSRLTAGDGAPDLHWQREMVLIGSLADFTGLLGSGADFLEHGLAVGIYAQELGRRCGVNREFALVAGLLHDIGRSWLACCHPRTHHRTVELIAQSGRPACEIECELFGMDHCDVGYHAARAWGLPAAILDALAQHHRPRHDTPSCLVAATHLADMCSRGLSPRHSPADQPNTVSETVLRTLGIARAADLGALPDRIEPHVHRAIAHWHVKPGTGAALPKLD